MAECLMPDDALAEIRLPEAVLEKAKANLPTESLPFLQETVYVCPLKPSAPEFERKWV